MDALLQRFRKAGQVGLADETGESLIGKLDFLDGFGLGEVPLTSV